MTMTANQACFCVGLLFWPLALCLVLLAGVAGII
jgi:hypothetical protein